MVLAFLLTLLAGMATAIGAGLALHRKLLQRGPLAVALAGAAGAMLLVSFVELLPVGVASLEEPFGATAAQWWVYGAFFIGMLLVGLIDTLLPKSINPSEIEGREEAVTVKETKERTQLLRSGVLVALVLALHNFPEGMATFFGALQDPKVGATLALAIMIHNIPEGVAVAAPIYAATKSRKKAFWWATASGVAEPAGALIGFAIISLVLPYEYFGIIFGLVAGMMVFIAIDELLPAAMRYQTKAHQSIYGLTAGMAIVAVSLLLLR